MDATKNLQKGIEERQKYNHGNWKWIKEVKVGGAKRYGGDKWWWKNEVKQVKEKVVEMEMRQNLTFNLIKE